METVHMDFLDQQEIINVANDLPPLPNTATQLMTLFEDVNYRMDDVLNVVQFDTALSGMLLRLANSASLGQRPTSCVRAALMRVGAGMVQAIAIGLGIRPGEDFDLTLYDSNVDEYWRQSVLSLAYAEELRFQRIGAFNNDFQTAAIVHDFGKLLIGKLVNDRQRKAILSLPADVLWHKRESMMLGVNHAEVTACVAQSWGLSDPLVNGVQFHHSPKDAFGALSYGLVLVDYCVARYTGRLKSVEKETTKIARDYFDLTERKLDQIVKDGNNRCEALLETLG